MINKLTTLIALSVVDLTLYLGSPITAVKPRDIERETIKESVDLVSYQTTNYNGRVITYITNRR